MTPEEFVDAIRQRVLDGAAASTIANLEAPPGRRPPEALVSLSHWFHGLTDDDKRQVELVARAAAHAATFSFLAVLDGVAAIEPAGPKGELRLTYISPGGEEVALNADEGEELHDVLNAIAYPWHQA